MDKNIVKKTLKKSELGASLVEYGLLIALIGIIAIPSVRTVGNSTKCTFEIAAAGINFTGSLPFVDRPNCTVSGGPSS